MPNRGQGSGHSPDIWDSPAPASFAAELRRALRHLHDPGELRKSPLFEIFGVSREQPAAALRRFLTDAIEQLNPGDDAPPQSKTSRIYHILYYRLTEQSTQREVALDLGLSIRHLRREETLAVQALADWLWNKHNLQARWREREARPSPAATPLSTGRQTPSQEQELQWLQASLTSEPVDVRELAQTAIKLAGPLAGATGVQVISRMGEDLPTLVAQPTTIRQALLSVLTAAIYRVPGGRVQVGAQAHPWEVHITVQAAGGRQVQAPDGAEAKRLAMARQLVELSGGSLEMETPPDRTRACPFAARLVLPAVGQVPILVVDDNADTLQLLQRYLANSRYRFIGTSDPQQALALAEVSTPRIIVLDVMLPGVDGWELLGRLHEHPRTRDIPIVVCTILPEEALALSLGAAGFLRKPVSRQVFLATLDRHLGSRPTERR